MFNICDPIRRIIRILLDWVSCSIALAKAVAQVKLKICLISSACLSLIVVSLMQRASACTVWVAMDSEKTLIAKNRDFYPGNQKFMAVKNSGPYPFFGLYADNQYDGRYLIKMGINRAGLVAFMTFASTIPPHMRMAKVSYYQVMEKILGHYANVEAIFKDQAKLFNSSTPINYVFADRGKAMLCEIGLNNAFHCEIIKPRAGKVKHFAQTNHYIFPALQPYNLTPKFKQQTSYRRLQSIQELMAQAKVLSLKDFIDFSLNTTALNDDNSVPYAKHNTSYQDNSIFRTHNSHPDRKDASKPNSDQNVSTMIVQLPKKQGQPIKLYLRIIDSIKDKQATQVITYREAFTFLDKALASNEVMPFKSKTCIRTAKSKQCRVQ